MSDQLNEFLSAAVDGEAEAFELRRVLDEAGKSEALAETWERYQLIGQALRNELPTEFAPANRSQADAVWAACFDDATATREPQLRVVEEREPARPRGWAGMAVAAAVSALAVGAVFMFGDPTTTGATPAVAVAAQDVAPSQIKIEGPSFRVETEVSEDDLLRANAYMLHHVQQSAMNQSGVASFVKVVTFEAPE
ncbi:MAG: sigma-E factor negative regulatory protein [Pseudomonadota bacterium]